MSAFDDVIAMAGMWFNEAPKKALEVMLKYVLLLLLQRFEVSLIAFKSALDNVITTTNPSELKQVLSVRVRFTLEPRADNNVNADAWNEETLTTSENVSVTFGPFISISKCNKDGPALPATNALTMRAAVAGIALAYTLNTEVMALPNIDKYVVDWSAARPAIDFNAIESAAFSETVMILL